MTGKIVAIALGKLAADFANKPQAPGLNVPMGEPDANEKIKHKLENPNSNVSWPQRFGRKTTFPNAAARPGS